MLIKPNLINHHDFEALPPEVWRYVLAWYSADWRIVRFLRRDAAHQGVFLDLHPVEPADHLFGSNEHRNRRSRAVFADKTDTNEEKDGDGA